MADKVTLQPRPSEPVVSRPLKTGASFTLVLPRKRFVYRHWDKEKYLPGEEGELIMEGEGIGSEKLEFIVERADSEQGPWTEVKTLKADVSDEKATAKFTFPKVQPGGHLTKVEWKRTTAKPGDQLGMHVEAQGYEGGFLSIHVERRNDEGEWDVYARWSGEIEQGKFDTVFPVPRGKEKPEKWKDGKVVELDFDGEPHENATAWMVAKTENFDGSSLQFVLERTDDNGNWEEVGTAVSTVKDGQARNSVEVGPAIHVGPASQPGPHGTVPVRFAKPIYSKGEELVVWIEPEWLRGEGFEVTMERRVLLDGESWEEVAIVDAEPAEAKGGSGGTGATGGSGGTGSTGGSGSGGTGATGGSGGTGATGGSGGTGAIGGSGGTGATGGSGGSGGGAGSGSGGSGSSGGGSAAGSGGATGAAGSSGASGATAPAAAGSRGASGGPSGLEIAGVAASVGAAGAAVAGGVKLAKRGKDKADEAASNKDDSADVEE